MKRVKLFALAVFFFILSAAPRVVFALGPLNIGSVDADFNLLNIIDTGSIGIGTSTPLYSLDVRGNAFIYINTSNAALGVTNPNTSSASSAIEAASSGSGVGVYGSSNTGIGVQGDAGSGIGVKGSSLGTSSGSIGIYGFGTSPGWAGYFNGPVNVTGSVTAASFNGNVSLSGGGNITFPNGSIQTTAGQPAFTTTVVVSPSASGATQSGTDLKNALAALCAIPPTAADPYLLKIEPGVYDLGTTNHLDMCPYVEIEGSGNIVTIIQGGIDSSTVTGGSGVVNGSDWSGLRQLTVLNNGSGTQQIAIYNKNIMNPMWISFVEAKTQGAGTTNYGIYNSNVTTSFLRIPFLTQVNIYVRNGTGTQYGVYNDNAVPGIFMTLINVSGGVDNYGIYSMNASNFYLSQSGMLVGGGSSSNCGIHNSSAGGVGRIIDTEIVAIAGTGVFNDAGTVEMMHSWIIGPTTFAIVQNNATSSMKVAYTRLEGTVNNYGTAGVSLKCIGAYDNSYNPVNCP